MRKRVMFIEESRTVQVIFNDVSYPLSLMMNFLDVTINAILKSGATGDVGDGKIFVSDIAQAYRIRTGEKGGETLN